MKDESITIHSLEVGLRRLERTKKIIIENYDVELRRVNAEIAELQSSIIVMKENELAALKKTALTA